MLYLSSLFYKETLDLALYIFEHVYETDSNNFEHCKRARLTNCCPLKFDYSIYSYSRKHIRIPRKQKSWKAN